MPPVAVRGPVIVAAFVFAGAGTVPEFHELPEPVDEPSATAVALPTE